MAKIDEQRAKKIMAFLAKRAGGRSAKMVVAYRNRKKKFILYYCSIDFKSSWADNEWCRSPLWINSPISGQDQDILCIESNKMPDDFKKCFFKTFLSKMFKEAALSDISSTDGQMVLKKGETLESVLVEMDLAGSAGEILGA